MKKILCIDDDPAGLQIRGALLRFAGYSVELAQSGEQGVEHLSSGHVDLVVLDYLMPGMNGADVSRVLKSRWPDVPILLLSAFNDIPEEELQCVDAYVRKGVRPELLLEKVRELLRCSGGESSRAETLP